MAAWVYSLTSPANPAQFGSFLYELLCGQAVLKLSILDGWYLRALQTALAVGDTVRFKGMCFRRFLGQICWIWNMDRSVIWVWTEKMHKQQICYKSREASLIHKHEEDCFLSVSERANKSEVCGCQVINFPFRNGLLWIQLPSSRSAS